MHYRVFLCVKPIRLDASNKNRWSAAPEEALSHETPAPCAREHQISVHALPPRELSILGAPLDYFGRAFSFPRNEFRHRFFRRHLARAARQERRRRPSKTAFHCRASQGRRR